MRRTAITRRIDTVASTLAKHDAEVLHAALVGGDPALRGGLGAILDWLEAAGITATSTDDAVAQLEQLSDAQLDPLRQLLAAHDRAAYRLLTGSTAEPTAADIAAVVKPAQTVIYEREQRERRAAAYTPTAYRER